MDLHDRVTRLEDRLADLRAIVDGGEVQSREAIVVAIGLLASFAAKSDGLDLGHLVDFLADEANPHPETDDRTAMLLHGIRLILTYHRDIETGSSEPPAAPALTTDERRTILRRARASLDFERENRIEIAPAESRGGPGPGH